VDERGVKFVHVHEPLGNVCQDLCSEFGEGGRKGRGEVKAIPGGGCPSSTFHWIRDV
jgi:hypothetical protein